MLRTNLSTRPFYNERAVHLALVLIGLIVLGVTLVNVVKVVQLSRHNTELSRRVGDDRRKADEFTREAAKIRRGVDPDELTLVVAKAREANALIDSRTFSWTALFNRLESELPADVMLAQVRPTVDDKGTRITMVVLARRAGDIQEFLDKLEATGAFEEALERQSNRTDEGLTQSTLEAWYVPGSAEPAPPKGPQPKATGGAARP